MIFAGCTRQDHSQTFTVKIEGKPYNLVHRFEHNKGDLFWSYKGELAGKVTVCPYAYCETVVQDGFLRDCTKFDTLSGKFEKESMISGIEGIRKGSQRCFVFIPENDKTTGEIKVTFVERAYGFLFW